MNIALLTSSHRSLDDRIYHHMANSLIQKGHKTYIISSLECYNYIDNNLIVDSFNSIKLTKKEKITHFLNKLNEYKPSIIICSEPLTVYAASKYTKVSQAKIIYDITEWYPSKKNLRNHLPFLRGFHFFKYLAFNIYALILSNAFIFGEYYKSLIPKLLFGYKPFLYLSYYPKKKLFNSNKPKVINNSLNLNYSGPISIEKGFINVLKVLNELIIQQPTIQINFLIIGNFNELDKKICKNEISKLPNNITVTHYYNQPLEDFIHLIKDTDIFMDLRKVDIENTYCLPIKLFYYMALERPVIFSNLTAISKGIDIEQFGYLINPSDCKKIANIILNYRNNPELYFKHCNMAKNQFVTKYNWEYQENDFLSFINGIKNES